METILSFSVRVATPLLHTVVGKERVFSLEVGFDMD
jgi:hypothetical protein